MSLSEREYFGSERLLAPGSAFDLIADRARTYIVNPSAPVDGNLQDARRPPLNHPGGPVFYVVNLSNSHVITVKDNAGGTVGTIATCSMALIVCSDNTTQAGVWWMESQSLHDESCTGPAPCNDGVLPGPSFCLSPNCQYFYEFDFPLCCSLGAPPEGHCPDGYIECADDCAFWVETIGAEDCVTFGKPNEAGVIITIGEGCAGQSFAICVHRSASVLYWDPGEPGDCCNECDPPFNCICPVCYADGCNDQICVEYTICG